MKTPMPINNAVSADVEFRLSLSHGSSPESDKPLTMIYVKMNIYACRVEEIASDVHGAKFNCVSASFVFHNDVTLLSVR